MKSIQPGLVAGEYEDGGYNSYYHGDDIGECPYVGQNTEIKRIAWRRGWMKAQAEDKARNHAKLK